MTCLDKTPKRPQFFGENVNETHGEFVFSIYFSNVDSRNLYMENFQSIFLCLCGDIFGKSDWERRGG